YLFEPILLTYVVSFTKPVYGGSRYLIFVAPAFYLLVSQGLSALRERWRPLSIALLAYLVLGSGYSLANHYWNATYAKDDYRSLARVMEEKALPEDGLVVMNGLVFDYYYRGESPRVALPQQYPVNQGAVIDELNRFSQGKSRLWFLRWKFNGLDPDDFILNQLEDHGEKLEEGTVGGLYYTLYRLSSDAPFLAAAQHPVAATFDNKVLLEAYSLSVERVAAGNSIVVTLSMKALQKLDQDYKVSLSLTDAQGYRWVQEDKPPTGYSMSRWRVGEAVQTRFRLNVPVGVPPGDYSLAAVVYAPVTLQPVAVFDSNQKPLGATLPMGRVRVDRGKPSTNTASVTPSHPEVREVAPGVRLLGYDMPAGEVDQGGILTLMLYWQALSQPQDDYQVSVRLTGRAGNVIQDFSEKPHHGLYPTTEWRQGEIVRDVHLVPIPGDASPGTTRVTVALTSPGVSDPQGVELATVVVKERLRTFEIPAVENPREVDLGGKVRFLGYALSGGPAFRPGGEIDLNLYWQA
ncbi:MAG TPA: hypothetical protein VJA25_06820, partial [Dehalococcoidia bacterium]|nr:hypothetical protein [Dehalococcoidia bacterium]